MSNQFVCLRNARASAVEWSPGVWIGAVRGEDSFDRFVTVNALVI